MLESHGSGRASSVGYQSCDDSTTQTGYYEQRRCAANANSYARADKLVAVIGPYNSYCARPRSRSSTEPREGRSRSSGPTTTYAGLTRNASSRRPIGFRDEPNVYYPTGERNFVRLVPGDDQLAAGQAMLAKQLGLKSVYVLDDGSGFWKSLVTGPFQRAARRLGLRVAGSASFNPLAGNEPVVAARVARSGAQGVMVGGFTGAGAGDMVRALRKRMGQRVTILGSFDFGFPRDELKTIGPAVRGMYVATVDLGRANLPLDAAGRQFAAATGDRAIHNLGVLEAGQATELLLQAIARSDGSRASVLKELKASKVSNGILGSFFFDANGDISTAPIAVVRITGTTRPGAGLTGQFRGSVLDRVLEVPASLGQ